ncbi:MAG: hypothetical protein C0P67_003065 [Bacillota bacterium]|jgi:hypothetical protein|uniref:hypothetical protein n=1 Tax=Planifilum fulgidum TaxID=201973 RepID=UPI001160DD4A|nr:hypothetical protein [Planifilum fulgidum]
MGKRIRLKLKQINPFPSVPEEVKKAVIPYKKEGEKENIVTERAIISGTIYHCAIFYRGRFDPDEECEGYLIIREDGSVPPFSEAKRPLN